MLARIRKYQAGEPLPPVPVVAVASDDVEAELARLSALLGISSGQLASAQRLIDEARDQISGYSLHGDGSVSLHFREHTALTSLLAASMALCDAGPRSSTGNVVELVPPECVR